MPADVLSVTPSAHPPLLAATLIVKNEATNLPGCLASLRGLVDEICVYDTGSTDGTREIARAAGARVLAGYWDDDFARARNAALDMTRATWALVVDADERPAGDVVGLRHYLAGTGSAGPGTPNAADLDLIAMSVVNVGAHDVVADSLVSTRIARRAVVRWTGTVHEHLRVTGTEPGRERRLVLPTGVFHVRHHGYADPELLRRKSERNLALAQAQLDDLVASGSTDRSLAAGILLDLGRSFLGAGRLQEAVDALETLRELVPDGLHRAQGTAILAQALLDVGGFDEAALVLEQDLRASALAEPQFCDWLRAQALARLGQGSAALDLLRGIDRLNDPVGNALGVGPVLVARTLLAVAAGRIPEAAQALLTAMAVHGEGLGYADLLLQLWDGRYTELTQRLETGVGAHAGAVLAAVRAAAGQQAPSGSPARV